MQTATQPKPQSKKAIKIQNIVRGIQGKDVEARRVWALRQAGFIVDLVGTLYNFGKTGTTKDEGQSVLVQIKYATGGRGKNGFSVNHCRVYRVR